MDSLFSAPTFLNLCFDNDKLLVHLDCIGLELFQIAGPGKAVQISLRLLCRRWAPSISAGASSPGLGKRWQSSPVLSAIPETIPRILADRILQATLPWCVPCSAIHRSSCSGSRYNRFIHRPACCCSLHFYLRLLFSSFVGDDEEDIEVMTKDALHILSNNVHLLSLFR